MENLFLELRMAAETRRWLTHRTHPRREQAIRIDR